MARTPLNIHPHVHSQAAGMLVVCAGTALPGLRLSPGTQVCASVWPERGWLQTPHCMPTCACDPSECACAKGQWVHMPGPAWGHLQERGPVLEHLVSPEGTVLLTSQNMPGALFWAPQGPPYSSFKPGHWWGVEERGFQTFLILWLLALVTTLWAATWSCV